MLGPIAFSAKYTVFEHRQHISPPPSFRSRVGEGLEGEADVVLVDPVVWVGTGSLLSRFP